MANASNDGIETLPRPKRPLSAYNMFFADERVKLLAQLPVRPGGAPPRSHGKMGFANMAKTIGAKWNNIDIDTKAHYDRLARKEKLRYKKAVAQWRKKVRALKRQNEMAAADAAAVQHNLQQDDDSDLSSRNDPGDQEDSKPRARPNEEVGMMAENQPPMHENAFMPQQDQVHQENNLMGPAENQFLNQNRHEQELWHLQQPGEIMQNQQVGGFGQEPDIMAQFHFHQELEAGHRQEIIEVLEPAAQPQFQHQPDADHNLNVLAERLGDEGVASMINLFQNAV